MKPAVNVAITGAAGQIGYALAFRVASGQMLGADTPVNLHLLEVTPALPQLAWQPSDVAENLPSIRLWREEAQTPRLCEPLEFDGLPKGGKGYKEATVEIERRINVLFDWLADMHAQGKRPKRATPPV